LSGAQHCCTQLPCEYQMPQNPTILNSKHPKKQDQFSQQGSNITKLVQKLNGCLKITPEI
jgi:hypothetical protein